MDLKTIPWTGDGRDSEFCSHGTCRTSLSPSDRRRALTNSQGEGYCGDTYRYLGTLRVLARIDGCVARWMGDFVCLARV